MFGDIASVNIASQYAGLTKSVRMHLCYGRSIKRGGGRATSHSVADASQASVEWCKQKVHYSENKKKTQRKL